MEPIEMGNGEIWQRGKFSGCEVKLSTPIHTGESLLFVDVHKKLFTVSLYVRHDISENEIQKRVDDVLALDAVLP